MAFKFTRIEPLVNYASGNVRSLPQASSKTKDIAELKEVLQNKMTVYNSLR